MLACQAGRKAADSVAGRVTSLAGIGLLVIFMFQNTSDVQLDFLFWHFTWPLWLVVMLSAVLGPWCGSAWA